MKRLTAIVVVSLLLLVLPNGLYRTFDRDEPKYLEATREMLASRDLFTPRFNCKLRFDKPPLTYWLIGAGYTLLGENEFSGRLFVSLCGVLTAAMLFLWLRKFDEDVAFWTSLSFTTTLEVVIMSSVAMPDAPLMLFTAASIVAFYEGRYILSAIAAGLAMLAKGPIGVIIPAVATFPLLIKRRKEVPWMRALAVLLLVSLPWYLLMMDRYGGRFLQDFFIFHNVKRFTTGVSHHSGQWWYYLLNAPWIYFPLSLFLPKAMARLLRERPQEHLILAFTWLVGTFVFFQTASTKLPHYLLPSVPAAAIITGHYAKDSPHFRKVVVATMALLLILKWMAVPLADRMRQKPVIAKRLRELVARHPYCSPYFYRTFSPEVIYHSGICMDRLDKGELKRLLGQKRCLILVAKPRHLKGAGALILMRTTSPLDDPPLAVGIIRP